MNKKPLVSFLLIVGLFSTALACGINFTGTDTIKEDAETLKLQVTIQALQMAQTAASLSRAQEQQQAQSQATAQPTASGNQGSVSAIATITPTPIPCNRPDFQSETIPDGTEMDPGESFTKLWRVKNDGTCTWNTNYKLVFTSGDRMSGPTSKNLPHDVHPGETIDLSIGLTAPSSNGEYKGYWKLQDQDSGQFGNYWVQIRVGPPAAAFSVTSVTFNVHPNIDMACPNNVSIKAEIKTSAAGKVTYEWKDSAGGSTAIKSLTFDAAGSKIVSYSATISASGDYKAQIYIDKPNHQWFGPVYFHVNCTP